MVSVAALTVLSHNDYLSRARDGAGVMKKKDAVKLDTALGGALGKDLGLKGIQACALKSKDQKEFLDMVEVSDLIDVDQVLKYFKGHARYWALACGDHNKSATYEQLAEWYNGRPYELWYAIQDRSDYSDVPYEVVEKLPPVAMGYLILRYKTLRDALTPTVASRLYIHDMQALMEEDPRFHSTYDKDWIVHYFGRGGRTLSLLETMGIFSHDQPPSIEWLVDVFSKYPQVLKNALCSAGHAFNGACGPRGVVHVEPIIHVEQVMLDDRFDLVALQRDHPQDVLNILRQNNRVCATPLKQLLSVLNHDDIADVLTTELVGSLSPVAATEVLDGIDLSNYIIRSNLHNDVTLTWLEEHLEGGPLLEVIVRRSDFVTHSVKFLQDLFSGDTLCQALERGGQLDDLRPQDINDMFDGDKKAMTRAVFHGGVYHGGPDWLLSVLEPENVAMAVINTQEFARMDPDLFHKYEIFEWDDELFEQSLQTQPRQSLVPPVWRVSA